MEVTGPQIPSKLAVDITRAQGCTKEGTQHSKFQRILLDSLNLFPTPSVPDFGSTHHGTSQYSHKKGLGGYLRDPPTQVLGKPWGTWTETEVQRVACRSSIKASAI